MSLSSYIVVEATRATIIAKLVNGTQYKAGRLVVYYNNTWGTVCDEGWDIRDAHVVCRMLGFHHALDAKSAAFFGEGAGPVWLSNLQCSGNESDISECSHSGWGLQNCDHNRDVGVVCTGEMFYLHFLYMGQAIMYIRSVHVQKEVTVMPFFR